MSLPENNVLPGKLLGLGTWLSSGSSVITELASKFSFDWLLFDLEHGCLTEQSLLLNLQAVGRNNINLIVRVPDINPALIARVLDWGASGIMLPHVDHQDKAIACLDAMRYPPFGHRGYSSSSRVYDFGLNKPDESQIKSSPILMVQIENLEGIQNADAIAGVVGVDVLFIGPSDLRMDLINQREKETMSYDQALTQVLTASSARDKIAGILISDVEDALQMKDAGFKCLAISSDIGILRNGYEHLISKYKTMSNIY